MIDVYSRTIVGWRVASNMKTETVLDAIEMARRSRANTYLDYGVARMPAANLRPFAMGSDSQRSALFHPLEPSVIPLTTRWLKQ